MTRREAITRNVLSWTSEGELFHANIVGCGLRCSRWTVSSSQESLSRIQTRGKSKNLMTQCRKLSELCLLDPTFLTLLQNLLFFHRDSGSLFCLCLFYKTLQRDPRMCPCVWIKLRPSCSHICIYFVALMAAFNFPQFPLVFQLSCIKKD